ncbi:hypothetical protein [Nocardiopsis sp. NRRL B-16309]|uniref:hypothetical protein n=1 Tax=Nocardiopsis sp. NRRL B-16309 TaxID=1519494 RepID=UPI0006AF746A|nr:hypothetical protein [Nocardiopsis sp. NRRL B-16309]KOX13940.1 hypothetical protein ADL05_16820 [Nocardiopsis sp. NRRL B-16309]
MTATALGDGPPHVLGCVPTDSDPLRRTEAGHEGDRDPCSPGPRCFDVHDPLGDRWEFLAPEEGAA